MTLTKQQIGSLAARTSDAYSFATYGEREWLRAVRLLTARGYNERAVEAILRSKITRWAADSRPAHAKPRGEDVINYIDDPRHNVTAALITTLVRETFNDEGTDIGTPTFHKPATGADLAGFCEGEDVADLIDLARQIAAGKVDTKTVSVANLLIANLERKARA